MTGSAPIDAERAFTKVLRSRRRAALARVRCYAIRDGNHRVSVARARGALTIDAILEPTSGDAA